MSTVSDDPVPETRKKTDGIPGVDRKHRPSDFYHERTNFQFVKHSRRYLIISVTCIALGMAALAVRGLNLGIDFKGGVSWEVKAQDGVVPTIAAARDALHPTGQSDARVTILSPASGGKSIRVQAKILDDPLTDIEDAIAQSTGVEPADVLVDVNGTQGTFTASHVSKPNKAAVEKAVRAAGVTGTVTVTGSEVVLDVPKLPASPQNRVTDALAAYAHTQPSDVTLNTVGPTWGREVSKKALQALVVFFIVLALYLAIRFELKMSAAAIVAVLHDIAFTVGVYAIFRFPVTPATITAFLTILGFSLYDTVVVFDKVAEKTASPAVMGRNTYGEMVDRSLNEVLMRSLSTSLVALLPVISLLVVGSLLLGATALEDFALALLAGLFVGVYSSLFVATPLLVFWKEKEPQYKAIKLRRARQDGAVPAPAMARVGAAAPNGDRSDGAEDAPVKRPRHQGVPGPPAVPRSPITPRPRQQRGRKRK